MSHSYFNSLWVEAQADFRATIEREKLGIITFDDDRLKLFSQVAGIYYEWISMYRKFDVVYDQIVHPQKLPLIRKLTDLIIARLIELRNIMVRIEQSEILYFDDVMHFYGWMPSELDIPIPRYYVHHDNEGRLEREALMTYLLTVKKEEAGEKAEAERQKQEQEKIVADFRKKLKRYQEAHDNITRYRAVSVIQTFERHRQGLERTAMAKFVQLEEQGLRSRTSKSVKPRKPPEIAAVTIQKLVRGFMARRRVRKLRDKEMKFLGLMWYPGNAADYNFGDFDSSRKTEMEIARNTEKRRRLRVQRQKNFEAAQQQIESRIRILEVPEMSEHLKLELRTWLMEFKEKEGKVPEIPKVGGSLRLFHPESLHPDILEKIAEAEGRGIKLKVKKEKKVKSKAKKEKKIKKKRQVGESMPLKLEPWNQLETAIKLNAEYNREWRHRDDSHNPSEEHEDDLVIVAKRFLVGQETRNKVDVLMRAELKLLKKALEKKRTKGGKKKGKGKKGKKKGKGKGKRRKKKKGKGKKRKFKDLTPDRTFESLFEELVTTEIIINYPKIRFNDLVGDYSLVNETIRKYFIQTQLAPPHQNELPTRLLNPANQFKMPFNANPIPSYGDIKRAVRDICLLPLGSQTVRDLIDFPRAVLIAGPPGSGKKSLVYALCTEIGATLLDLSSSNLVGKYVGKSGLVMLIHLMNKMGRLCQPTVIMIDKVERMYGKKLPKTDRTEPKRLKKQLKKFLKLVGPEDRILVIGLTSEPWIEKMKPLKKTFDKFIWIPKPDHESRLAMWQKCLSGFIMDFHPHLHIPLLAKLSDNWTLGNIKLCAERSLNSHKAIVAKEAEERDKPFQWNFMDVLAGKLLFKPVRIGRKLIRMDEVLDELSLLDPIFMEEEKAWNSWFNKSPLQKLRLAFQQPTLDNGNSGSKGKKKGKPSRKKK